MKSHITTFGELTEESLFFLGGFIYYKSASHGLNNNHQAKFISQFDDGVYIMDIKTITSLPKETVIELLTRFKVNKRYASLWHDDIPQVVEFTEYFYHPRMGDKNLILTSAKRVLFRTNRKMYVTERDAVFGAVADHKHQFLKSKKKMCVTAKALLSRVQVLEKRLRQQRWQSLREKSLASKSVKWREKFKKWLNALWWDVNFNYSPFDSARISYDGEKEDNEDHQIAAK